MYLPGLEDKHYYALTHLRGNQDFHLILEGLQVVLNNYYKDLAKADEFKDVRKLQGMIQGLESIFQTYNYAPEYVEKLKK